MAGNSIRIVFCFPSEKGSTRKGNILLPIGSKFFPFRVDLFSEEGISAHESKQIAATNEGLAFNVNCPLGRRFT